MLSNYWNSNDERWVRRALSHPSGSWLLQRPDVRVVSIDSKGKLPIQNVSLHYHYFNHDEVVLDVVQRLPADIQAHQSIVHSSVKSADHMIWIIWNRFGSLWSMINRANDFFGCISLYTHCDLFLALSGLIYVKKNPAIQGVLLPFVLHYFVLYSSRLGIGILLMCKRNESG